MVLTVEVFLAQEVSHLEILIQLPQKAPCLNLDTHLLGGLQLPTAQELCMQMPQIQLQVQRRVIHQQAI